MTTPEMAAEVSLDVLIDLAENGADIRSSPEASGARFTVEAHGSELQLAKLNRLQLAAARKHGANPSRSNAGSDGDGKDRIDRAIDRALGLEQK